MRQWYVLRSNARKELAASAALTRLGIEVYVPTVTSRVSLGRATGARPLFPGYLFGRLDPDQSEVAMVNRTAGIRYVLSYGNEPIPVPDDLISAIHSGLTAASRHGTIDTFRPGDPVRIITGPFKGIDAVFDKYLSGPVRVRVLIRTLQGAYHAQLDVHKLRAVGHANDQAAG